MAEGNASQPGGPKGPADLLFPCLFNLIHCRRALKPHRNEGKHVLFVQTAVLQNGRTLGYTSASSRVASWRFFQGTVPALVVRTWSPQIMPRSTGGRGYVNEWAVQGLRTWSPQIMPHSTGGRGYVNEWAVQCAVVTAGKADAKKQTTACNKVSDENRR